MTRSHPTPARTRGDRCPGVGRPWPAADGLLVRLRLVGGAIRPQQLSDLLAVSATFGDGRIHLTRRANLQLRGLPGDSKGLDPRVVDRIEATGLLPTRSGELTRNILVSPQTGIWGGRTDMRRVALRLDHHLITDKALGGLPGRFLFTLDDGRGDMLDRLTGTGLRGTDLGLIALDSEVAQLRVGDNWSSVVYLEGAADELARLAHQFLRVRGAGADAAWHVRECDNEIAPAAPHDHRMAMRSEPLAYGAVAGGIHVYVRGGVLTPAVGRSLIALADSLDTTLVITPWHGIFVPDNTEVPR